MTLATLSAGVIVQSFPGGTVDPGYTFTVVGTLADGTPFATSVTGPDPSVQIELAPGTYTGTVSKLGVNSLPSAPFTVEVPATVEITVPDPSLNAVFSS